MPGVGYSSINRKGRQGRRDFIEGHKNNHRGDWGNAKKTLCVLCDLCG